MSYPPGPGGGQPPQEQPPYGQPPQGSYPGHGYGGPPPHQPYGGPPGPRPGVPAWVWIVAGVGILAIVLLIVFLVLTRPSDSPPLDVSISSSSDYSGSANMTGNMSGVSDPAGASGLATSLAACTGVVRNGGTRPAGEFNRVIVNARGVMWNSAPVDPITLRQYLDLTSTIRPVPTLITQVEPDANPTVVERVREVIRRSLACEPGAL